VNREDVIRMAREAGCVRSNHVLNPWSVSTEELERFAALVAAEKDKEIARLREENIYLKEVYEDLVEDRKELFDDLDKAVAAEREACLALVNQGTGEATSADALKILRMERDRISAAIRARGET